MHAVNIYIDETLNDYNLQEIKNDLMTDSHVLNVAYHNKMPHDILVEYEERHIQPIGIVNQLESHGLHVDITSG